MQIDRFVAEEPWSYNLQIIRSLLAAPVRLVWTFLRQFRDYESFFFDEIKFLFHSSRMAQVRRD